MLDRSLFFTDEQIDELGEAFNISLGASSSTVYMTLGRQVNITAPDVQVSSRVDFELPSNDYMMAIEVNYIEGLYGKNVLLLKKEDVRKMLEIMMMMEIEPETFEIDEIGESAMSELMNQMMGAAATGMSRFFDMVVNISTPTVIRIENIEVFKQSYFKDEDVLVTARFGFEVADTFNSDFLNIMSLDFAEDMLANVQRLKDRQ
jgi:flagellar motor switch protein FliN/FliY